MHVVGQLVGDNGWNVTYFLTSSSALINNRIHGWTDGGR